MRLTKENYMESSDLKEIKLGQLEDLESKTGFLIPCFIDLFLNGFYARVWDDDHDDPYVFHMEPRSFDLDIERKVITVYWQDSDEVYAEYDLADEGKTWSLAEETLLNKEPDSDTLAKLREMFNLDESDSDEGYWSNVPNNHNLDDIYDEMEFDAVLNADFGDKRPN